MQDDKKKSIIWFQLIKTATWETRQFSTYSRSFQQFSTYVRKNNRHEEREIIFRDNIFFSLSQFSAGQQLNSSTGWKISSISIKLSTEREIFIISRSGRKQSPSVWSHNLCNLPALFIWMSRFVKTNHEKYSLQLSSSYRTSLLVERWWCARCEIV